MTAERLTTLGACAGLALLFGSALEGWSKKAPATPCAAGRFLVDPANGPLVQGASTGSVDSVTLDGQGRISVGSGCLAVAGRITAKRHFTKLKAKWPSCGSALAAHLKAKIVSPDCGVMTGRFKTKGGKPKRFTARRSRCGDGIIDEPGGEQCEPGVGGCAGGIACTAACTCESPPTTTVASSVTTTIATTTTLETTTTTVTSSTTTTVGYTCGADRRLCSGTCPGGQICVSAGTFPFSCECRPTCGTSAPTCDGICPSGMTCRLIPRLEACECTAIIVPTTIETTTTTETTTSTSTTETTTTTLEPCHTTGFPTCAGVCPPRFTCLYDGNGIINHCGCFPVPF